MIKRSNQWKKLQRKSHLGNKMSEITKTRMRIAHTGKPSNAVGKHWKLSGKSRINQSNANKLRVLSGNHNFWKGGITPINNKIRKSIDYKLWREAVFKRDNFTCIFCYRRSGKGQKIELNADHIKPFAYYPELRFAIDNGRTLCKECHENTDTYMGRAKKHTKIISYK